MHLYFGPNFGFFGTALRRFTQCFFLIFRCRPTMVTKIFTQPLSPSHHKKASYGSALRASMAVKRLSSLAIININRGVKIDYKRAVKIFLELHLRKLKVSNLLFYKYIRKNNFYFIASYGRFFSSLSTPTIYFLPTRLNFHMYLNISVLLICFLWQQSMVEMLQNKLCGF